MTRAPTGVEDPLREQPKLPHFTMISSRVHHLCDKIHDTVYEVKRADPVLWLIGLGLL